MVYLWHFACSLVKLTVVILLLYVTLPYQTHILNNLFF